MFILAFEVVAPGTTTLFIFGLTIYARNSQKKQYFNIWRNEKYVLVLLIYQLFGYFFGQNSIEIIVDHFFVLDFAKIVNKQLINK